MSRPLTRAWPLAAIFVASCLALPATAAAATIGVTRDDDPGLSDPAGCSLRQALEAANTNGTVGTCTAGELGAVDTIQLPVSARLTTAGSDDVNVLGDLDVLAAGPVRIVGTGVGPSAITQTVGERVLNVVPAAALTLERVLVTGGNISGSQPGGVGGGILMRAASKLTLINSTVSGNTGQESGGIGNGTRTSMDKGGDLLLLNSTVSGNTALANSGGGMGAAAIGVVNGTTTVVNSTISGNSTGGRGGGFYNEALQNNVSSVDVVNSTIANNSSSSGASAHNSGNGGVASFRFRSSVLADARDDSNCGGSGNGTFTSMGFNLFEDESCNLNGPADRVTADALLGPLVAGGGETLTHALLPGSPAIDQGTSDSTLATVGVLATDQRALTRPFDFPEIANAASGDGTDIGAFELQPTPPPPPPPPPAGDETVRVGIAGKRFRISRRGVVRVRVSCPQSEQSPPCRGKLTLRTGQRVRFRGRSRLVVLASARFQLDAGASTAVRLAVPRRKVGLVRASLRARRVLALAGVRDAAGNRSTVEKRVRVLPPLRRQR